jgi:hypothetical protein
MYARLSVTQVPHCNGSAQRYPPAPEKETHNFISASRRPGLFTPAGTPPKIIGQINAAVKKISAGLAMTALRCGFNRWMQQIG